MGAAPALSSLPFSSGTPCTHKPRCRALSTGTILRLPSKIPPGQHFCRKGAVLLVRCSFHSFHGVVAVPATPLPELSHTASPR